MLGEFDRKAGLALFRQIEEILSENMLHVSSATGTNAYITEPVREERPNTA
jgi:hypothetical protein